MTKDIHAFITNLLIIISILFLGMSVMELKNRVSELERIDRVNSPVIEKMQSVNM